MDITFREEAIRAIVGAVGVHYALLSYDVKVRFQPSVLRRVRRRPLPDCIFASRSAIFFSSSATIGGKTSRMISLYANVEPTPASLCFGLVCFSVNDANAVDICNVNNTILKLHACMPTPFASQRRVALVDHPRRFHLHIPMGTGLLHLFKMDLFCEED